MRDKEFRKAIAKESNISYETVTKVLNAFKKILVRSIVDGKSISIINVGTFVPYKRAARWGHDPVTKEPLRIEECESFKFIPARSFRATIKYGYKQSEEFDDV